MNYTLPTHDNIKKLLKEVYDLEKVRSIQQGPTHFLYLIHLENETLLLKFHDPRTFQFSDTIENIFQVVADSNLGTKYLVSKNGKLINFLNHMSYSVFHLIPGEPVNKYYDIVPHLVELHQILSSVNGKQLVNHFNREIGKVSSHLDEFNLGQYYEIVARVEDMAKVQTKQIIHGDLHSNNILVSENRPYFIDFNAAKYWLPMSDSAFCAFRLCDNDYNFFVRFINNYCNHSGIKNTDIGIACALIIYEILERIVFILNRSKNGDNYWRIDLDNQYNLLKQANKFLENTASV